VVLEIEPGTSDMASRRQGGSSDYGIDERSGIAHHVELVDELVSMSLLPRESGGMARQARESGL
jgi:hypothetical protein